MMKTQIRSGILSAFFLALSFVHGISEASSSAGPIIVMAGDSITEQGAWKELFPVSKPVTKARGGHTTRDVLAGIEGITGLRPTRVFLMIGVNDLARGDDPTDVYERYVKVLRALDGTEVFIQSTLPCATTLRNPILGDSCPALNQKVDALNAMLRGYSQAGVRYVDLTTVMTNQTGLRPEFSSDGLHLNAAGYAAWRDAIFPLVEGATNLPPRQFRP